MLVVVAMIQVLGEKAAQDGYRKDYAGRQHRLQVIRRLSEG